MLNNPTVNPAAFIFITMYRISLLIISFLFIASFVFAQQGLSTFKITDSEHKPVAFSTIQVVLTADSNSKFEKVTDSNGVAVFSLVQDQFYKIRITSINFQAVEKNIVIKGENPFYEIMLHQVEGTLGQVIVRANKPLMRQEDDKTIVDPENLASISTNAFETIEKTPGLFIDPDGNIYISSTTPAKVYINGREQKMSAADVASMLKSLPPNAIASIEIMRTPSARYDASGSGGVVNVILRKGVRIGLTGSINTGMQQGRFGNQFLGLNINNNNGKLTTNFHLNVGRRNQYDRIATNRLFSVDSVLSQDAFTRYSNHNYYFGYNINYQLNKKWELGYDGRLSFNDNENNSSNTSFVKQLSTSNISQQRTIDVFNEGKSLHFNQGLDLRYKIDSIGSEWTTDLSFTLSPNESNQYFILAEGDHENRPRIFTAQTNLAKKLNGNWKLETGLKNTSVQFNNSTDYYFLSNGSKTRDDVRSGAYSYRESINAAYLQASKSIGKLIIKSGVRLENTNMEGRQLRPKDTSFSLRRTDLFPYVYISRSIMTVAGYDVRAYLVYRRTINRPAYEQLNPSTRFIDPYLFETGNPTLRPQFTQNYEANISVDEKPLMAIGFNDTKDIFTQVIYPSDTSNKISYKTFDNLGSNKETYIRVLGAIPPGKRYFFVVGVQYNQNFYQGLYESKPLSFKKSSWMVFTYQTLRITPVTVMSVSGYARFKGQQQFYELGSFGELRLSLNQQFLKKKLVMTLSVNDIFRTNKYDFTLNQGSMNASGTRMGDSRRFGINLRYNFGIRKKEENNFLNVESPEK